MSSTSRCCHSHGLTRTERLPVRRDRKRQPCPNHRGTDRWQSICLSHSSRKETEMVRTGEWLCQKRKHSRGDISVERLKGVRDATEFRDSVGSYPTHRA